MPAIQQAEIPYEPAYALSSLHLERQFRCNWPARGMTFAIKVPLRNATPSIVPLIYKPFFRRETAHNQFMRFPDNNDESNSPALLDNTTRSDKSMVSFSTDSVGYLCILVVADELVCIAFIYQSIFFF